LEICEVVEAMSPPQVASEAEGEASKHGGLSRDASLHDGNSQELAAILAGPPAAPQLRSAFSAAGPQGLSRSSLAQQSLGPPGLARSSVGPQPPQLGALARSSITAGSGASVSLARASLGISKKVLQVGAGCCGVRGQLGRELCRLVA
jgi:hypothetical protein